MEGTAESLRPPFRNPRRAPARPLQRIMRIQQFLQVFVPESELARQRLAVSLCMFILGVINASWASRIPDVKASLGIDDAALGLALLAMPLGTFPAMALAPKIIGAIGARRLIILSAAGCTASLLWVAGAGSVYTLMASLFLMGFLNSFLNIANNTQAVVIERRYGRSIMVQFHGCWSLGGVVGGLFGGIAASFGVGPSRHFLFILVFNMLVLLFAKNRLIEDAPARARADGTAAMEDEAVSNVDAVRRADTARRHGLPVFLLLLGVVGFCSMLTEGSMYDWNSVYFVSELGETGFDARAGYLAAMVFMVTGRFTADAVINRFGERFVLTASSLLMTTGLAMMVALPGFWTAVAGSAFVGIGMASVVPICYSLAGRSRELSSSAAISLVSAISFWGFLIGPPLIGFISHASSLRIAFGAVIVAPVLIVLLSPVLDRMKRAGGASR